VTQQHTVVRGARCGVAICAVLLAMGCGRAEQSKARPETAAAAGGGQATPSLPGTLAKPLDQYSGDELFSLTRQLRFGGGVEVARRCRGRAECRGSRPNASTRIRVDAVAGGDSLNPANVPTNGVIAARALNHGQYADTMYNTRPGAEYENYLIVTPVPGSATAAWRLEELTTTAGQRTHRTLATGTFRGCNHTFVPGRGPLADFKTCAQAATIRPASFGGFLQGIESPIWIDCFVGCCTAE
jgi:hypothetical protein